MIPIFSKLVQLIRQVIHRVFPFHAVETAERIDTPLSTEMINALDLWHKMYIDAPPWQKQDTVKTLNLPALICAEIARQILLEVKWNITGKAVDGEEAVDNPRATFLKEEFEKLMQDLRLKLEQGCASGGMVIKPYPKITDGHLYFNYVVAWSLYPVSFDDDGGLHDVIFRDTYQTGKTTYTRLERHTRQVSKTGNSVKITQRVFKSNDRESLGVEVDLTEVSQWADLQKEVTVTDTGGQLFGWFKTAAANNVDIDSPMGISVFHKAANIIREADVQYSRLLWEYEGSELAIDVDPTVLKPKQGIDGVWETPKLNERLFRGTDLNSDDSYHVFSPAIRDGSYLSGLNQMMIRIEDNCGLARGTLSDPNTEARTATELNIVRQRTYATISENQKRLELCLRDVIRAMDVYASLYNLAPAGEYDVSFEWDDSIINDAAQQLGERLELVSQGIMSKTELRQWYFGETEAQAQEAVNTIQQEAAQAAMQAVMASAMGNAMAEAGGGQTPEETAGNGQNGNAEE